MDKTKLTKDEYLDSLDPDNLNLEKSDLIDFCHGCVDEWKKNKVKITPEDVLKAVWKKILVWFWDLQFKNALADNEGMLKKLREIGSG